MGILSLLDRVTRWGEQVGGFIIKRKRIANANKIDKDVDSGNDSAITDKLRNLERKVDERNKSQ